MSADGGESRSFAVVTTCHASGYEAYGRRMLETFDRHWPADVPVHFYSERFDPSPLPGRVRTLDLLDVSPELVAFKARHRDDLKAHGQERRTRVKLRLRPLRFKIDRKRGLGFQWDAVRFAHKSFAILHAAANSTADVLLWIDSDTCFFGDVDAGMLESFVPPDCFAGCLRRRTMWTETGFLAYNLRDPHTRVFLAAFRALYVDDLLFREKQYHDAWLFDRIRERVEAGGARTYDIAQGLGDTAIHVLVNSRLGAFMDHLKGDRKATGSSRAGDFVVSR